MASGYSVTDCSDGQVVSVTDCSDSQVVSVTDCSVKRRVFEPSINAGFQCSARSLHSPAFYDAITGPTELIISIVSSVKLVICRKHEFPSSIRKEKVSVNYYIN